MDNRIYKYYIGLNDKDKKKQLLLTDTFMDKLNRILQAYGLRNYTIYNVIGYYLGIKTNTIIVESTLQISETILNDIKKEFNQECILEVIQNCESNFI